MEAWKDIVAAAILGTERKPFVSPDPGGEVGSTLSSLKAPGPEAALLDAAAVISSYRTAGHVPVALDNPAFLPQASTEDKPLCSARASEILRAAVADTPASELIAVLQIVADAGFIVPADLLPVLLKHGQSNSHLRPVLADIIGQRGVWLARQKKEWGYILGSATGLDESAWDGGKNLERAAYLRELRATDPARGRTLLDETWKGEPAAARRMLLETVKTSLGTDDETFLQKALTDRSKEVRAAAFDMLARLPESTFVGRMIDRARAALRFTKGLLKSRFDLEPPEELDAAAKSDGLDLDHLPKELKAGVRAHALCGIVSAVPLSFWSGETKCDPERLLRLVSGSDWKQAIESGWQLATIRQRDPEWSLVLLEHVEQSPPGAAVLLSALPPARREEWVLSKIAGLSNLRYHCLLACPAPWGPRLSRTVADIGFRSLGSKDWNIHAQSTSALTVLFQRAGIELYEEIDRRIRPQSGDPVELTGSVLQSLRVYQYRHDLAKEMST